MKRFQEWLASAGELEFTLPELDSRDDPRFDELFAILMATPDAELAARIEYRIWVIWHRSGDDRVDALMAAGLEAMAADDHDAALAIFDDMVRRAPEFPEGWNKRATVHYLRGDCDAALADIEHTLELEPRHFGALSGRGLVHLRQDRPREALAAFEAAIAIHPHLPGAARRIEELQARIAEEDE